MSATGDNTDLIFRPPLDGRYRCEKCKHVLRDPQQLTCGHRYCRSCIDELLVSSEGGFCPACQQENPHVIPDRANPGVLSDGLLLRRNVHEDPASRREIGKLKCVCINKPCTWSGLYVHYEAHVQVDCQHANVPCPKCGTIITRASLEHHAVSECDHRQSSCRFCKIAIMHKDVMSHEATCPKALVTCEYCIKSVPREVLTSHRDPTIGTCPRTYTTCPYGCKDPMRPENLARHMEKCPCPHLDLMLDRVIAVTSKLNAGQVQRTDIRQDSGFFEAVAPLATRLLDATVGSSMPMSRQMIRDSSVSAQTIAAHERCEKLLADHYDSVSLYRAMQLTLDTYMKENENSQKLIDERKRLVERHVHMKEAQLLFMSNCIDSLEMATYDGTLLWKVSDVAKLRQDALSCKVPSVYSHSFYTSRIGYRMCARLYLNGDGTGKNTHMSLFFVLQKGPYDALLKWPFTQKVTLSLVNQNAACGGSGKDLTDAFRADPHSSSFRRPISEMNIASGCPMFCSLDYLFDKTKGYIKDDTLFIKIQVDKAGLDG